MQPHRKLATLFVLISLMLSGSAMAWDEAKLKSQVQGLLNQIAADFVKKNLKGILATSAPEAVIKYRNGRTLDMASWGKAVAKEFADWKDVKSKFVVEKVWPIGKDRAGAVYRERHQFTRTSDPGHQHAISARFRAVLTKSPQGWRFLEFKELGVKVTRDGKPVSKRAASK